ncbi:MAG: PEP-CTERM sorting domain-containing protein [Pontiellaceae bacterium]|nr:PEP-CTERM sorting domain-containing protein [Pontiellaceae bacterium]MBN2783483.1 PEP-CTERM sorting domain-containing protein [Pontiellaceae bacterium]
MNKGRWTCVVAGLCLATVAGADTIYTGGAGGDMRNAASWNNGLPGAGNNGLVNTDAAMSSINQNDTWMAGATVTIEGGATVAIGEDTPVNGGGTLIVNNATLTVGDDVFASGGTIILNNGSAVTANDDFEATTGIITINGGIHSSGAAVGNNVGAQTGSINILGGQITAGTFRFQSGSTSSVGGGATLLSASSATALDMSGSLDILSGWSGSWEVGTFSGEDWKTEVTGGGWTLNGAAIDGALFDSTFTVSGDGTTLSIPEPATLGLIGMTAVSMLLIRRFRM